MMPDRIQITHTHAQPMTTPDFHALCAELLQAWQFGDDIAGPMNRARAALQAEPEGEGPSETDLYDLAELFNGDPVPAMRRALEVWGAPAPSAPAALKAEPEGGAPSPSGYAYRYHSPFGDTCIRFNGGQEVNGGRPIEAVPYWFAPPSAPATPPASETAADALAARPLLEKVAQMGDTLLTGGELIEVWQVTKQADAWLRSNPPGQPVAIEPRGCPMPGACSCVEPTPPAPEYLATDQLMAANLSALLIKECGLHSPGSSAYDLLQRAAAMLVNYGLPARSATPPAPEKGEVGELVQRLDVIAAQIANIDIALWGKDAACVARAATLLQQQEAELDALRGAAHPTLQDAIKLAEGCHDYSGGHSGAEGEAWHGAIGTVVDVLKRAAIKRWDSQLKAVYGVGVEAQAGELAVSEPVSERLRIVRAGIRAGYNLGHHHTVEGGWGDPDEVADDIAQETLDDIGLPPAPQCLMARMADELDRLQTLPAFPPVTSHPLAAEARALLQGTPAIPQPAPQAGEVEA